MERRLAAILAADAVGYSRLIRANEEGTITAFNALRAEIIEPTIREYRGRVFKLMGDGLLVEFASVVDAVRAAVDTQQALVNRNGDLPEDQRIAFRMGINLGDVIIDGDDIQGDGVNVAARLESLAEPDGVYVAAAVYDQVRDRVDIPFEDMGEMGVKNIDRPVRVWRWQKDRVARAPSAQEKPENGQDNPSIVVLPFDNMSQDPEQSYFSDGICEDIITDLSKLPGLLVIARNSAFAYKGKTFNVSDVCRELGVKFALEGSVRKAGNRVRVTAQLIDGGHGGHLWAERYDRDLTDIFAVQDDVTEKIVGALEVNLAGQEKAEAETVNLEAYDLMLRGREQYKIYTTESNQRARELFEQAIGLDEQYAAAYAGMAETYLQDWFRAEAISMGPALELAEKAKELGPNVPIVFECLATVYLFERQHEKSFSAVERWLEIEPGNAEVYALMGGILTFAGEPERTLALIEKAVRLNPFYPFYYMTYKGQAEMMLGRYHDAIQTFNRVIARSSQNLVSSLFLAASHGHLGERPQAQTALAEVYRLRPDLTKAWFETLLPYKNAADLDALFDGLQKAGMDW